LQGAQGAPPVRPVDEGARLLAAEWALDDRDAPRAGHAGRAAAGVARRTQALRLRLLAAAHGAPAAGSAADRAAAGQAPGLLAGGRAACCARWPAEALDTAHDAERCAACGCSSMRPTGATQRGRARGERAAAWGARGRTQLAATVLGAAGELEPDERERMALALLEAVPGMSTDWLPRLETPAAPAQRPGRAGRRGHGDAERQLWGKARRPLEQAASAGSLCAPARRRAWRSLAQLAQQEGTNSARPAMRTRAAGID
jgi:HemY protein